MPRYKKISADEARAKRNDHVRSGAGGEVLVKGIKAPPSWNKEQRSARFIMTSESVDRYGDIVVQAGLDLTRFLENPQGLLFHNSRSWPAGSWSDVTKVLSGRPKRTEGTFNFLPDGTDEDADRAARHVSAGSIRTVSIGFAPNWDDIELILDDEEEWVTGLKFNQSELLECSLVPIPAQPDALVKDAGGDFRLARDLIEEVLDTYAKTPEGLLIPMGEYEKAYKTVVEKIADDASTPAPTVTEVKSDEPDESTKDDEPEGEPMEATEEEKAAEIAEFKAFLAKHLTDDSDDLRVFYKLAGKDAIEKGVTVQHPGTDTIEKFEFKSAMTEVHRSAIAVRLSEIDESKAAPVPENKTETPAPIVVEIKADTSAIEAAVTKAEGLFSGLMRKFPLFFPKAVEERIEPSLEPPTPPAPPSAKDIAAVTAKAAAIRERLATKGLIAA